MEFEKKLNAAVWCIPSRNLDFMTTLTDGNSEILELLK